MPYDPLTPAIFRAAKAQFTSLDDATLQTYIDLASRFVDRGWLESDYQPAWVAATCHLLTLDGYGGTTEAEIAQAGGSRVSSLSSGSLSISFAASASSLGDVMSWFDQTTCGRFYALLLRMNRAGPRLLTGQGFQTSGYAKDWPWPSP